MITYVKRSNADKYSNLYERATQDLQTHSADGMKVDAGSADAIMSNKKNADGSYEDGITSLEEYFSYIIELNKINSTYTVLPLDEEVFTIDANTRQITVPAAFLSNGISVQGDEVAEIVYFKINRFYDATDLATKKIYIQWTAPNGDKGVSAPWVIDIESEPNYIIFGWPLSSAITAIAGTVSFSVRFYSVDDETEKISYSLATLTQTATIKPSLDFNLEDLATEGVDIDNANALITGRFENTIPTGSSAKAEKPVWLVDLDEEVAHITSKDEDEKVVYADLDKDSDGFRTVAFDAHAQALAPDAGQLSYYWKAWNYDTGVVKEVSNQVTMVETKDTERVEGKLYYYMLSSNGVNSYKLYTGADFSDDTKLDLHVTTIYEKMTTAVIDEIGKYRAFATNRVRNAQSSNETYTMIVPRPVEVAINTNLADSDIIKENAEYKTTLSVAASVTDQGKITYQWFKKAPAETEFSPIEDATTSSLSLDGFVTKVIEGVGEEDDKTVIVLVNDNNIAYGDGYYYCVITNNLNKELISTQSNTVRVTHEATAPKVEIVGNDAYSLTEIAGIAAMQVEATIPVNSGEMVPGWRTDEDSLTYQWYRYYAGNGVVKDDMDKAVEGTYVINHDVDLSTVAGFTDEQIEATRKNFYDPTEAGYYFCVVTNTYNGTTASKISRFFTVADA